MFLSHSALRKFDTWNQKNFVNGGSCNRYHAVQQSTGTFTSNGHEAPLCSKEDNNDPTGIEDMGQMRTSNMRYELISSQ